NMGCGLENVLGVIRRELLFLVVEYREQHPAVLIVRANAVGRLVEHRWQRSRNCTVAIAGGRNKNTGSLVIGMDVIGRLYRAVPRLDRKMRTLEQLQQHARMLIIRLETIR